MIIENFTEYIATMTLSSQELAQWIESQKVVQSNESQVLDNTIYNQGTIHTDITNHIDAAHQNNIVHSDMTKPHTDTSSHSDSPHNDTSIHNNIPYNQLSTHSDNGQYTQYNQRVHSNTGTTVDNHSDYYPHSQTHTNKYSYGNGTHAQGHEDYLLSAGGHRNVLVGSSHYDNPNEHSDSDNNSYGSHVDQVVHADNHANVPAIDGHTDSHVNSLLHTDIAGTSTTSHSDLHSNTIQHNQLPSTHSNTDSHSDQQHQNNTLYNQNTKHVDVGFNHSNFIPLKPAILNIEQSSEKRDTFDVGFYSYDKNSAGEGTQDSQSTTVKYVVRIRQLKDRSGNTKISDWVTYVNGESTNSFSFNSIDPLKMGNADPKATEGYYELEAYSYNDAISIKGVSKTYESPRTNIVFNIIQNKDPIVTITSGADIIGHTFGLTGTMRGGAYYRYEDKYPTASVAQKKGVFIDLKINDPDAEDYHKVEAYLSNSDGSVQETAIVNGVVSGSGTNKNAKAFIPLDYFDDNDTYKEYYVTVRVTDYKDAGLTKLAGSVITTQKISPSGLNMRFFADVIVPSVTFDTPSDFWNEELKIQANLTDMQSGINGVYYQVFADGDAYNNSNWKYISGVGSYSSKVATSSPTFTLKGEGKFRLAIKLIDNGGNTIIKISSPYKVGVGNQKPIAVFNPLYYQLTEGQVPDKTVPIPSDDIVYYNDYSKDPEGLPFTQKYWTIKNLETGIEKIFVDKEPYSTFETSGMGLYGDGVGTYEVTLKVKDKSPDGFAAELWSDPVTKILVIDHPLKILGLSLEQIVAPPEEVRLPVQMPVTSAVNINTGYKLVYETTTKAANTVTLKFYANGRPLGVYSSEGANPSTSITQLGTGNGIASHKFEFYLDKKLPIGTVIDIKVEITKINPDGSTKVIVDSSLGSQCMIIQGSSEQDITINQIQ